MRKKIFGGNWKQQVTTIKASVTLAQTMANLVDDLKGKENFEAFICPSFTALPAVGEILISKQSHLKLGAQNVSFATSGAFTGEVSVDSLIECHVDYVLIGHSERRRIFNESNELLHKKIVQVLDNGLKPVLCIGESAKERQQGNVKEINWRQLSSGLAGVSVKDLERVVIAYEPVWAINNKYLTPNSEIRAASPIEAGNTHKVIREWFRENYSEGVASGIRIQYGGSMNQDNCNELLSVEDIDGGLIGSASLSPKKFLPILEATIS